MGADFELKIDSSGKPIIQFIDKGGKKVNVGSRLSDFKIEKKLGQGNFGSVCLVTSQLTHKLYALKEIKGEFYNSIQKREVEKEIKLLEGLNHPHVITYFSSFQENGNFYIVIEYINGGSLENLYKKAREEGKVIREKLLWDFLIQTLSGLVYLHENKKIIHRDIKPDNLLLDKDDGLKISDFGISAVKKDDVDDSIKCHNSCIGPIKFMAPELATGNKYDFKSDIYMLGLTFFNLMSGNMPDVKVPSGEHFNVFVKKNSGELIPNYYSDDLKKFIQKLLTVDPNERPSAKKAFTEAIAYYTIKYLRITSILATLECFLVIPKVGEYFKSERIENFLKNDKENRKYLVTKVIKEALDYGNPNNFNYEKMKEECLKLRLLFYTKNEGIEKKSLEIDHLTIFEDICNKLHRELNIAKVIDIKNQNPNNAINEYYLDDKGNKIDEADEKSVITAAVKKFGENFRSRISDQMYFLTKTVYGCPECQRNIKYITSFHCAFCLHPERAANWLNKKDLDLYDLFSHTTKNRLFYDVKMDCKFCRKVQKDIYIKKIYYTSPINMIVGMDSSKDDKFNIKIEEYINLSNFVERTDICKTNYRLIGAIFNEKNEDDDSMKYISYTKDTNGHWKYFNGKSMQNSNFDEVKNHKHLLSLFYTSL